MLPIRSGWMLSLLWERQALLHSCFQVSVLHDTALPYCACSDYSNKTLQSRDLNDFAKVTCLSH